MRPETANSLTGWNSSLSPTMARGAPYGLCMTFGCAIFSPLYRFFKASALPIIRAPSRRACLEILLFPFNAVHRREGSHTRVADAEPGVRSGARARVVPGLCRNDGVRRALRLRLGRLQ